MDPVRIVAGSVLIALGTFVVVALGLAFINGIVA